MKKSSKTIAAILLSALFAFSTSCSGERDYGTEFNLETDCQYSYFGTHSTWNKVQSDGEGQYVIHNHYIYYYNDETHKLTPLCNKPNCLHDMESDRNRQSDCNAFTSLYSDSHIQYYEGNVYSFFDDDSDDVSTSTSFYGLYRISKDGSRKDKIFTMPIDMGTGYSLQWLIHRGRFYYGTTFSTVRGKYVNSVFTLKSLELSSNMDDKDAKVIYQSDENASAIEMGGLKAYLNYVCFSVNVTPRNLEANDSEEIQKVTHTPTYIYNTETGQSREIQVPEGCGDYTRINNVVFLKDRLLIKLYNSLNDYKGKAKYGKALMPIYSMKYDLTDVKVWNEGVQQGKLLQSCGDYVILSDAWLQEMAVIMPISDPESPKYLSEYPSFGEMGLTKTNVEIYSAEGDRISWFVYPMNYQGNFNGFGPDGYNAEFKNNDDGTWSVFRLKLDDVLHCRGETVEPDCVSTRRYGALNQPED